MPIEVRELIIKATVDPRGNAGEGRPAAPGRLDERQKSRLIRESVEQTLDVLRRKNER